MEEIFEKYSKRDQELAKERHEMIVGVTKDMEEYRFYMAGEKIYHYTWHTLADILLEESKKIFSEGNEEEKESRKQFLLHTLRKIVVILHPFMPFVTEEIWQSLLNADDADNTQINADKHMLMIEKWPI